MLVASYHPRKIITAQKKQNARDIFAAGKQVGPDLPVIATM